MLNQKDLNRQIINIGPDEEFVTINKVAEICSNLTGSNLKPIFKKDRPREVKHATCSADKARKLLNYKTSTDLKTGISKTFDYIKNIGFKCHKQTIIDSAILGFPGSPKLLEVILSFITPLFTRLKSSG